MRFRLSLDLLLFVFGTLWSRPFLAGSIKECYQGGVLMKRMGTIQTNRISGKVSLLPPLTADDQIDFHFQIKDMKSERMIHLLECAGGMIGSERDKDTELDLNAA